MADFCKQCSIELFGKDEGDLRMLLPTLLPGHVIPALCEDCGYTAVNLEGECVGGAWCSKHGTREA
jgi:hypothetical protein